MPPKNGSKGGGNASKKANAAKKDRVIEDKTFGIKNKKGAKQQKFIQQVQVQVQNSGISKEQKIKDKDREDQQKAKADKMAAFLEMNKLLNPTGAQHVPKGADPSTLLCSLFKAGLCTKGKRCKFAHDLSLEAKSAKRSMFKDERDKEEETNEDWLEADLQDVINKKHGTEATNTTRIICKHFLDAVENYKYGWFWKCTDGAGCKYRHALPGGYVLKRDRKKDDKGVEVIAIEDLVERQRGELSVETTQLTIQTFLEWKKKRLAAKAKAKKAEEAAVKKTEKNTGSKISGADMFKTAQVTVEEDADEEGDEGADMTQRTERVEERGTWQNAVDYDEELRKYKQFEIDAEKGATQQIGPGPPRKTEPEVVAIDEDLFDDDEDLDGLDEELEEMTLS